MDNLAAPSILKKMVKIIRSIFLNNKGDSTVSEFSKEVAKYKAALGQSYANVLGKKRADKISDFHESSLSPDSYFFKTNMLKGLITSGFSTKENLVFYVAVSPWEKNEFKIDSTGKMSHYSRPLMTAPCFFFSPKIIEKHARVLEKTSLPAYLTLWVHEYSHFIGYCLQKRPVSVAMSILYFELIKANRRGLSIYEIEKIRGGKRDELSAKVAETIMYLHWLDEDMANYLQELILKDLGFDPGNSLVDSTQERAFYPYFKKWGRERFVAYIADWNNANFKAPQFMKTFLKSLNTLKVERLPIGDLNL